MNSTQGLTKSVLMDNVPSDERGRWTSLEAVNRMSWSGSAVIGGWLIGEGGILFNFYITAIIQIVATVPLFFLFRVVPVEGENVNAS